MTTKPNLGTWTPAGTRVPLDLERLITTRLLVQANSGQGKSWALRRIFEQLAGHVQQLIIDPEGEFATLREKHDFIICAGQGGDVATHPRIAGLLARRLLETEASAVLDISELKARERHSFVRQFLESLIEAPKELRHPVLVAVDEAQVYAPEKGESEAASAVIDIATRGRKRGLCLLAATQRISMFNKDAAAELKNRLIGGTTQDLDVKRAAFDLGLAPQEARDLLRALKPGQFYAYGPAFHELEPRVLVTGEVETTHPEAGTKLRAIPPKPTAAIVALLPKLADLPKEAEEQARTIDDFKRELANARRELAAAKRTQPVPAGISREELKGAEARGFERGDAAARQEAQRAAVAHLKALHSSAHQALTAVFGQTAANMASENRSAPIVTMHPSPAKLKPATRAALVETAKVVRAVVSNGHADPSEGITGPEQRILNALAWLESTTGVPECEQTAVAFLAGYTFGAGGFNNPKSHLNVLGHIAYVGDGRMRLTDSGRAIAQAPTEALTQDELHARVLQRLPGPEQRILKPVLEAYPDPISAEAVAEKAGYTFGSGGFNNPRSRLRTLGLIEYVGSGQLKAAAALFPT